MRTIAERVAEHLRASGSTQGSLAAATDMTEPQLSKSLAGSRKFSALELARIADYLKTSLYELVTGEPDPMAVTLAARHSFDGASRAYSADGFVEDQQTLQDIVLLYRQAYS